MIIQRIPGAPNDLRADGNTVATRTVKGIRGFSFYNQVGDEIAGG